METEREIKQVNISVRNLVEFILRAGDLDSRSSHMDVNAMQEGSRIHRKLQKAMGSGYRAEVSLKLESPAEYDGEAISLLVEGRADGIFEEDGLTYIDEIKTTLTDVSLMTEPVSVHRSQAMCYAYIYALQQDLDRIGVQMTYCNQETETVQRLREEFEFTELSKWYERLINEYAKWVVWQVRWQRERDASVKEVPFPFEYREGQRKLVGDVYRTISRSKKLFVEAPTGVGKTISTVFPATRAMGEGLVEKIFYGTAKTIARTVAEETFALLIAAGMKLKCVTITSKEKMCLLEKPECNPVACERARGHFDRVNDAVYDMLTHEERIDRKLIEEYAEKHCVCPFEMCLDVTTWADAIICDYNYIFDPDVHLRRFFENEGRHDYCFLIDEAHNLVERAREMYSAELIKEDFLAAKALLKNQKTKEAQSLSKALDSCNKVLLGLKRECDEFTVWDDAGHVVTALMRFMGVFEDVSSKLSIPDSEPLLDVYFAARHFCNMYDLADENYMTYSDYVGGDFRLRLQCMDPSANLKTYLSQARSTVFFSATLLPVTYYKEQLGGSSEDYAVYAPSPFDGTRRLLMVARDVSTRYTRRSESEYRRIADYIAGFTSARTGNYMVFFPSYVFMESVAALMPEDIGTLRVQGRSMAEEEKEEFLAAFTAEPEETNIGFCVMGGIFAEGIDLTEDRLIGVVVVGTGLPMVCNERELFRHYFDEHKNMGFEYAYLYNGMNKVLQAAGRVIRTVTDVGAILLLDERFLKNQYSELFPAEWDDVRVVTTESMKDELITFWDKYRADT